MLEAWNKKEKPQGTFLELKVYLLAMSFDTI
jgi:hypothetical protein